MYNISEGRPTPFAFARRRKTRSWPRPTRRKRKRLSSGTVGPGDVCWFISQVTKKQTKHIKMRGTATDLDGDMWTQSKKTQGYGPMIRFSRFLLMMLQGSDSIGILVDTCSCGCLFRL